MKTKEHYLFFHYLDLKNSPSLFTYLDLVLRTKMYLKLIYYYILYYLVFRVDLFIPLFCKKIRIKSAF